MPSTPRSQDPRYQRLDALRLRLLDLHKLLLDQEKANYEKANGPIPSSNTFLQLVIGDVWFAWLHSLSGLVVQIDEAMDSKEQAPAEADVHRFMEQTKKLLRASENGVGFEKHYYDAFQADPEIILAHAEVMKLVAADRSN